MSKRNQQIVIMLVENKPGVLNKVASLCRRRRYNINSLTVGTTNQKGISQITLVFAKERKRIENIVNQIDKLIEVISVEVVKPKDVVDKELILMTAKNKEVIDRIKDKFSTDAYIKIINQVEEKIMVEILAEGTVISEIIEELDLKRDVERLVRSGLVALKM
jgi:acetolactate synthase-1/3 small subunit